MPHYEPSAAEIDAALGSLFSHPHRGWKRNARFANREFWRQTMREALIAANAVRIRVRPTMHADTVDRRPPIAAKAPSSSPNRPGSLDRMRTAAP
jgi:hypothetical protein